MKTPDTTQTLFIRACKYKDPHIRVDSVYSRFYVKHYKEFDYVISTILMDIVEDFCPISLSKLTQSLSPDGFYIDSDDPYWTRVKKILISHIRLSHRDCFGNMRVPKMFGGNK